MSLVWDTTVASRLRRDGPYDHLLLEAAAAGDPVALAAPTVMETVRGLCAAADTAPRFAGALDWWQRTVFSELVDVLPLDADAAAVAGRLGAKCPTPPTARRTRQSKPDHRAGWVLDLQIAACAWVAGRAIATDNVRDFAAIRDALAELYPSAPPLEVVAAPVDTSLCA